MTTPMAGPPPVDVSPAQPLPAVPDAPVTAAQAEAQAEADPTGSVRVWLGDETDGIEILVPDRRQWRNSSLTALNVGDFQRWADATLTEEDAVAWEQYDPTLEQIDDFFARLRDVTGDDPGKRSRSRFGSRGMRRR